MRTLQYVLITILTLAFTINAQAADVHWSTRLHGTDINGSHQFIVDGDFASVLLSAFTDADQFGYARLGIEDVIQMDFRGTRTVKVNIDVTPYSTSNVAQTTIPIELEVTYDHDGADVTVDANDYRLPGVYKFEMTVTGVTIYDETSTVVSETIPDYIFLESGIQAERYYDMDPLDKPTLVTKMIQYNSTTGVPSSVSTATVADANTDEMYVSWSYVEGAEYYDLEWTWVDNYSETSLASTKSMGSIEMDEAEFRHNSTRIRTGQQFYRIPHTFGRGYIIIRVRAVGRWQTSTDTDLYGKWSSSTATTLDYVDDWPTVITVSAEHEDEKNWQYQATYAEDGKKKEVIQYFDGSLRGRQTVTRINSDDHSVVGETMYDNQGRGTIQILPVPQINPAIKYYTSLNENSAGTAPYSHIDFDWESSPSCVQDVPGSLSSSTGAGLYYSAAGHSSDTDWQQYVPESNGYAFTQVEYTPDNTGRVRSQSGLGDEFTIGSDHATMYYYAQPSQEELDRLFGYKVGYMSRYKKNMVVDANGQVSISYLDAQGRVVATSLAGTNETPLDDLYSENNGEHGLVTNDLLNKDDQADPDTDLDNNDQISTGAFGSLADGLQLTTQITVVSDNSEFDFEYTAQTGYYQESCDETEGVKFPYVFDLVLSLKDDCGTEYFSQTYENIVGDDELNTTVSEFLQLTTEIEGIILDQGTYTLTKQLILDYETFEEHLAAYLDPTQNECLIAQSAFATTPATDCSFTCDECLDELGSLSSFLQQAAVDEGAALTTTQVDEYTAIYNTLKDECMAPCEITTPCDSYHDLMILDLSPNGQYASTNTSDALSILNTSNSLGGHWQTSGLVYLDQYGSPAEVAAYEIGSTGVYELTSNGNPVEMVTPQELNLQSFIDAFQSSWAEALLPFHPEYDLYEYAEEICTTTDAITTTGGSIDLSSDEFDAILRDQITTYDLAGTGLNGNPYGIDFTSGTYAIYDIDPYANLTYTGHGSLSSFKIDLMEDFLTDYNGSGLTLLQTAVKLAVYPNNYSMTTISNAANWTQVSSNYSADLDEIWQQYRLLYLSKKAEINQFFSDIYGFEQDVFNGCIGPDDLSTVVGVFSNSTLFGDVVQYTSTALFTGGTLPLTLCGSAYDSKSIRIARTNGLNNSNTPAAAQAAAGQAYTDYVQWQQTGLCPLTIDMERLLNQLATEGLLLQTNTMDDIATMVPDLYEAISGGSLSTSSELDMIGTINGSNQLQIEFKEGGSSYCTLTIPQVGGNTWATYGTWQIFDVYNSYPTGTANNTQVIILAGTSVANAQEYVVTYSTSCATLNDCQSTYANNNQYDPDCTKEEDFENGIEAVLGAIADNGDFNNTGVTVSSLSEFTNSVLPDYFDGTVTWNGSTGTFTFSSGSYQIGFTPASSTFFFDAYDIVDGVAYGSYFTGTSSSATAGNSSGSYTYSHSYYSLNFNCSCGEMVDDNEFLQASVEDLFLELFNYVLDNPSTSDGTELPEYIGIDYYSLQYTTPAFYDVSVNTSSSLTFDINELGVNFCSFPVELYWSGYTIASFVSVEADLSDLPTVGLTINVLDTDGRPRTITTSVGYGDCPLIDWCEDCTTPYLTAPISCTDAYSDFYDFMNETFSANIVDPNNELDEQAIFDGQYVGTQEAFCNGSYAYIESAYEYYITEMSVTSIGSALFLTIGEFGNTVIGYDNDELKLAVDDYVSSLSVAPKYADTTDAAFLPWNDFVSLVYALDNGPFCAPVMGIPNFPDTSVVFDCNEWVNNVYESNEYNQYNIYLDQIGEAFMQSYVEGAINSVIETFHETHDDKEYHYTLYYYDRGGNLVQTVPPMGVDRLEVGEASTLTYDQIDAFRISDPYETQNTITSVKHAPEHTYNTVYHYNSLNQLVYQATPDGGESRFAYDALGRLVMSQNAKQAGETTPQFSYTVYDGIGRVAEVGELDLSGYEINDIGRLVVASTQLEANEVNQSSFPTNLAGSNREEVTRTIYDELIVSGAGVTINVTNNFSTGTTTDVYAVDQFEDYASDNTRNRIVGVVYQETYATSINDYESAIFYDYDVHGNVKELIQVYDYVHTKRYNQHLKHIEYEYDLVSGNVNRVVYQDGQEDQFIHRYAYDSDNRITIAETSKDGIVYEKDAKYFYYDHGPLARTEVGEDKIQASDYAYTIQGWIKTVNGEEVDESVMMGSDGDISTLNENVARDVFGYSLCYYANDYDAATTSMLANSMNVSAAQEVSQHGPSLYNGNIRAMYIGLSDLTEAQIGTHQTKYSYDQLNRITSMDGYYAVPGSPNPTYTASGYSSSYEFDDNGNLTNLQRYAWNGSSSVLMDNFVYKYEETTAFGGTNNNQLSWVNDLAGASAFSDADIDNSMTSGNYDYDAIGQLKSDADESISLIEWKVTNKVEKITFGTADEYTEFDYNPMGNRIAKHVTVDGETTSTFYILDAQGNQMAIYQTVYAGSGVPPVSLEEYNLFGSSRVGSENVGVDMEYTEIVSPSTPSVTNYYAENEIGDKRYEFSNHLGNVLQVLTDRKLPEDVGSNNDVDYFTADVVSYSDYYPYGMLLPERHETAGSGYRYGYQGSEKDDEIKGNGNSYTTHFRQLDPRVGRWLSIDPKSTAWESPYVSMGDNPILNTDVLGDTIWTKSLFGGYIRHEGGKAYDTDGNEVTDLKGIHKDVHDRLLKLNQGEHGESLVQELEKSEFQLHIKRAILGKKNETTAANEDNAGNGVGSSAILKLGRKAGEATNSSPASPKFITLGHELVHVRNIMNGARNLNPWTSKIKKSGKIIPLVPLEEKSATEYENLIRKEHNIEIRTHYDKRDEGTKVESPKTEESEETESTDKE